MSVYWFGHHFGVIYYVRREFGFLKLPAGTKPMVNSLCSDRYLLLAAGAPTTAAFFTASTAGINSAGTSPQSNW